MKPPLKADQLRRIYPPTELEKLPRPQDGASLTAIIGQQRAEKALRFGLGNRAPGFNVYVSAPDGNEILPVIRQFLKEIADGDPNPSDWCYVNNFQDAYCPNALRLPGGRAREFKQAIANFIEEAREALIKAFESEDYAQKQQALRQEMAEKQQEIFSEVAEKAREEGFVIQNTPTELRATPLQDGEPMTDEQFEALDEETRNGIIEKRREIVGMLHRAVRRGREYEKEMLQKLGDLEENTVLFAIKELFEELLETYGKLPEIPEYLDDLKNDILENIGLFLSDDNPAQNFGLTLQKKSLQQRYEVNVLVGHDPVHETPIVVELNPTYNNLFGKIERESVMGTLTTNFTLIRAGALHRANGGYLVLPVMELLQAPFSWENLKRALRNQQIEIEDPTEKMGFITARSLKPEAIPLNLQVILTGPTHLFSLLNRFDEDFSKLFKVKADFDSVIPADEQNLSSLIDQFRRLCEKEELPKPELGALSEVFSYGHRLAEDQEKLTSRFETLADIIREAGFYAKTDEATSLNANHIQRAIEEKKHRSDLVEEKIQEMIEDGTIMVSTIGKEIGQINGLSVLDLGDTRFGRPSRITVSLSVGNGGIIDIEREAKMGGAIHSKGVMILSGFLYDRFGQDKSLSLTARLVFEQSYSGVDGDSASLAELLALISALGMTALPQGIAVTGSINQKGEVQAVGGINEKIEGFFEVCKQKGLNGSQGVIIPAANAKNLMLETDVRTASAAGKFSIWAVKNVEEALEILTGTHPGDLITAPNEEDVTFTPGSLFEKVDTRLRQMIDLQSGDDSNGGGNTGGSDSP